MNLYSYANNNPINWTDPFGLCPEEEGEGDDEPSESDPDNIPPDEPSAGIPFWEDPAFAIPFGYVLGGAGAAARAGGVLAGAGRAAAKAAGYAIKEAARGFGRNIFKRLLDERGSIGIGKRTSPRKLRREWESQHGKSWPKDSKGRNYDADHNKPLADGGGNEPSNITPRTRGDHIRRHQENGDFKRWGARRNK
jgi:hypothetical protein